MLNVREKLLLLGRATRLEKRVASVAGKSAGEIVTIVRVVASRHTDFVAVIYFGDSPRRQQHRERKLQFLRRHVRQACQAPDVMIAEKRDEQLGMRVEAIARENVNDVLHRGPAADDIAERVEKRKIEHRRHARIDSVELSAPSREERCDDRVAVEYLAHRRHARINAAKRLMPLRPETARDIGKSVQPVAIDTGFFSPP